MKYPFAQSSGGATPLMYACQQCRENEVLDIIMRQPLAAEERDRTLKTPLHYCAENVNTNCAEAILRVAPELVNSQDMYGYCTLHLAIIAGNLPLIKLLISKGADVNLYDDEGHSPVHWAVVSSESEALDEIVRAGADPSIPDIHGGYPLHYAVQMCGSNYEITRKLCDAVKVVHKLLDYGVNVNVIDKDARQPILWAASAGSAQIIKDLVKNGARVDACDKDGLTALHCAASRGHTETIETLVNGCGAEVDIIDGNGCSSLFYAVTLGHADATAMLLQLGAQPNRQDRKGRTPAHCGAAKGQLETLKILEKFNGNLWLRNVRGDYPLHEAVTSGRKDLVQWFLDKNADAINVGNNDGRCLLHVAAMYNHVNMLKMLLENKCLVNPVMRSNKGVLMTPLNVALCKGHRSCAKLLQLHGGVPFSKVAKSDSHFENPLRISPLMNRMDREKTSQIKENVSPSFTVIKTSTGDDSDAYKIQYGRKKNRRRKKRRNNKNEKKLRAESDSEGSVQDQRVKITSRENSQIFLAEDVLVNDEEEQKNNDENDKMTSAVALSSPKNELGISSEVMKLKEDFETDDLSTIKSSHNVFEKMSSPSPENLSLLKQAIKKDFDNSRLKSDGVETPVKNEIIEKNDKDSNVIIMTDNNAKNFKQNETIESKKTQRKTTEKDDEEGVQMSFHAMFAANDKKKNGIPQSSISVLPEAIKEGEEKDKPLNLQEEMPFKRKEKTEIIHSKVVTVKKSEKTTKILMKKEDKFKVEDPNEQGDKPIKLIQGKTVSSEENSVENFKIQKAKNEEPSFEILKPENDFSVKENFSNVKNTNPEIVVNQDDVKFSDTNENVKKCENREPEEKFSTKETFPEAIEKTKAEPPDDLDAKIHKDVVFAEIHEITTPMKDSLKEKKNDLVKNGCDPSKSMELETSDNISKHNKIDRENGIHNETKMPLNVDKTDFIVTGEVSKPEPVENIYFLKNSKSMPDLVALGDEIDYEPSKIFCQKESVSGTRLPPIMIPGPSEATFQAHDVSDVDKSNEILPELNDSDLYKSQSENEMRKYKKSKRKLVKEKEALTSGKCFASADEPIEEFQSSPLNCQNRNNWLVRNGKTVRPCRRIADLQQPNQISVNQFVQNAIRKYHLERGIFHQLLELKRLQIRAGRANEQVLVKRLVDEYERTCASLGTRHYGGAYKFKELENFLYDQLRIINRGRLTLAEIKSYDDIDTLSEVLKKSRCELMSEMLPCEPQCACLTQRCHHSTKAYTTLPCSAYVARIRRNKTLMRKRESFLPQLSQNQSGKEKYCNQLATLELVQGDERQVIELPSTHRGKRKKYYITFTIQSAHTLKKDKFSEHKNDICKHRHAKSV